MYIIYIIYILCLLYMLYIYIYIYIYIYTKCKNYIQLVQSKKLTQQRLDSKEIKEILYIGSFPSSIL